MATPVIGTGVLTRHALAAILAQASAGAAANPLGTMSLHLFANPVTPTLDTPLAALTECSFDGYGSDSMTMTGPSLDLAGDTVLTPSVVPSFGCTGTVTVQTVYGWYALGEGTLAALEAIGTLVPFVPGPGQTFSVKPQVGLAGNVEACLC